MTKTSWNGSSKEGPTEGRMEGPDYPEEDRMNSAGRGPGRVDPSVARAPLVQPSSWGLEVSTREK